MVEEQLEAQPQWKEVPDLMMETGAEEGMPDVAVKRKQEKVAQGWRKRRREDYISADKREHSRPILC